VADGMIKPEKRQTSLFFFHNKEMNSADVRIKEGKSRIKYFNDVVAQRQA